MSQGTPSAEIEVAPSLARELLADQHPDLADRTITKARSGWDNVMLRLGDDLALRFPRRTLAADLLVNEQRFLPSLAARLPIATSVPVRIGRPGRDYPWQWSVVPWIPGGPAGPSGLSADAAEPFAEFLRALHVPAPDDAPVNPYRGVPLAVRQTMLEARLRDLDDRGAPVSAAHREVWARALEATLDLPRTWLHGDLHPANILVEGGRLSGVIDWGDLCAGDAATDLAALWLLFDDEADRERALAAYGGVTTATHDRARGWAFFFAVVLLDSGLVDGNAAFIDTGRGALRRLASP